MALPTFFLPGTPRSVVHIVLGIACSGTVVMFFLKEKQWMWAVAFATAAICWALYAKCDKLRRQGIARVRDVYGSVSSAREKDLRVSVYIPHYIARTKLKEWIRFPDDEDRSRATILVYQGVVGRCYRTRTAEVTLIKGDFRQELIREYGFTSDQVRRLAQNRKSYMTVPILNDNKKILGVICAHSTKPTAFRGKTYDNMVSLAKDIVEILEE